MLWLNIIPHIPKGVRYTLGSRIENKFLDLLELAYIAYFTDRENKMEKIIKCILILDLLKFLISVAWEGSSSRTGIVRIWRLGSRRSVKCWAVGRKIWKIRVRKTAHCKIAERKGFRSRNTIRLSGFHSKPGFAQLSFSHKPSSLRSSLKTFGLLSGSVLCGAPSKPLFI